MSKKTTVISQANFEIVPSEIELDLQAKNSLELSFRGFFEEADRWKKEASAITNPKTARAARLELKGLRVAAEKKRKELKEDSLRMGRAIDGANNILKAIIIPLEKSLEDIEKEEERRIAAEEAARTAKRVEEYRGFHDESLPFPDLSGMTDEQFSATLKNAKTLHELKEKERARIEAERLQKEKEEAEAREKQRLENIRLKKEAEAREKQIAKEREEAAKERAKAEAKAKKEAEAREAKLAAERAKVEAKAKKEAAARRAAEEEAQKLKEAEEARREKEAAEKAAKEKAAKEKAAAPDRDKILAFAKSIRGIEAPSVKSDEAKEVCLNITDKIEKFAKWIEGQAKTI